MNATRVDILRNAAKIHEEKNRQRTLPKKRKVESTEVYNDSTSFSFSNPSVMRNIEIAQGRMPKKTNLMKFDGELVKGSRNYPFVPHSNRQKSRETKAGQDGIHENIRFNQIGEIYQDETDAGNSRISENMSYNPPRSGSNVVVQHFIAQIKFVLSKVKNDKAKTRLERLLKFLHSGAESVSKLGLSPKNHVTEGVFNTGVSFQRYLNFISTPDDERGEKPDFYMEIFGNHIENPNYVEMEGKREKHFEIDHSQDRLSTFALRELKPKKDDRKSNNKFLKSLCEKIKTVEDIITVISSIGFCIDGPLFKESDFQEKEKLFVNPIKQTLTEEYDI